MSTMEFFDYLVANEATHDLGLALSTSTPTELAAWTSRPDRRALPTVARFTRDGPTAQR